MKQSSLIQTGDSLTKMRGKLKKSLYNLLKFLILIIIFLSGCATPKQCEIIGEWIPISNYPKIIDDGRRKVLLKNEPRFVFNANGTFSMWNIPQTLLIGPFEDMNNIVSGSGTWTIGEYQGSDVVYLKHVRDITDNKLISTETFIWVSKWFSKLSLYFMIGGVDGIKRFEFEKCK